MGVQNNIGGREPITFSQLALALANDYDSIYVIDEKDDSYVEYSTAGDIKEMSIRSSGDDFFDELRYNCRQQVYQGDQEEFLKAFKKESVLNALKGGKSFTLGYRLMIDGEPKYYSLKGIRGIGSKIVLGVQNVDEQVRRELAEKERSRTYSEIAQSLASLFEVIYHIDVNTGHYTEYSASESYSRLGLDRGGEDFFEKVRGDILKVIHKDDCDSVLQLFERDNLIDTLKNKKSVSIVYRQMLDGKTQYLNLIALKMQNDSGRIVIGVRNIDKQKRREKDMEDMSRTFGEIAQALAARYEVIYHVNIETNEYREYSASEKYKRIEMGAMGKDFFADSQKNMKRDIYPEDYPMMALAMRKDYLLDSLKETGKNFLNYRLMLDGRPQYVTLFAVRPKEDSSHIIIAVANVDAAKRMELDFADALGSAMDMANRDELTGVKNKRAYAQAEMQLDEQITGDERQPFAIAVCDINGLKQINDSKGHKAGDDYIKSACSVICNIFKHSPVFRIGGDEFAVILKGSDFDERDGLMCELGRIQEENSKTGDVTIAAGLSVYDEGSDIRVQDVFERADEAMYENKKEFKLHLKRGS